MFYFRHTFGNVHTAVHPEAALSSPSLPPSPSAPCHLHWSAIHSVYCKALPADCDPGCTHSLQNWFKTVKPFQLLSGKSMDEGQLTNSVEVWSQHCYFDKVNSSKHFSQHLVNLLLGCTDQAVVCVFQKEKLWPLWWHGRAFYFTCGGLKQLQVSRIAGMYLHSPVLWSCMQ